MQGQSLNTAFIDISERLEAAQRALFQQLVYGVIRWFYSLEAISQHLLSKPLKAKDTDILALILIGIYQLRALRIPDHAALSETVNAARLLNKPWASGLINACLRQYQRQQDALEKSLENTPVSHFAHPAWMLMLFKQTGRNTGNRFWLQITSNHR